MELPGFEPYCHFRRTCCTPWAKNTRYIQKALLIRTESALDGLNLKSPLMKLIIHEWVFYKYIFINGSIFNWIDFRNISCRSKIRFLLEVEKDKLGMIYLFHESACPIASSCFNKDDCPCIILADSL